MTNDLQTAQQHAAVMPFNQTRALAAGANAGAVAIEQERAIAEAQGQLVLAKKFPRDLNAAYAELMEGCKLPALAAVAFYTVPQGGQKVTGPSIRLAEEIARVYGNFEFGHRELARIEATPTSFGKSEVEVYAWDKQTNNRSIRQITVMHVMDTRDGPKKLRDQRDIDNKIANVASKQLRGRILAMMPKWMVEAAMEECRKTLAGNNSEPLAVRVRKMTQAFATYGVTHEHLEAYLGHSLDATLADELVDLQGVFNALREGAKPSEFFGEQDEPEAPVAANDNNPLAASLAAPAAAAPAAESKPAPAPRRARAAAPAKPEPVPAAAEPVQAEPEPAAAVVAAEPEPVAEVAAAEPEPALAEQAEAPADTGEYF